MVVKSGIEIDASERRQERQSQTAAARQVESQIRRGTMPTRMGTLHPARCGRTHPVVEIFAFLAIGFVHWIWILSIGCFNVNRREKLPETIWGGKNRLLIKKCRGKKIKVHFLDAREPRNFKSFLASQV